MNPKFPETLLRVRERLLAERGAHGHWEGELSPSALSTATAVLALALVDRSQHVALIRRGLDWLKAHANPDGGWGDTVLSKSNISTTALVWAAFGVMNEAAPAAEAWLAAASRDQRSEVRGQEAEGRRQPEESEHRTPNPASPRCSAGASIEHLTSKSQASDASVSPRPNLASGFPDPAATSSPQSSAFGLQSSSLQAASLVAAIVARYGKDRTFSVPILTACALAGRVSWEQVLPLPFELAVLPHQLFRWLRLPVVSYALPALIAIGQVRHHHLPPRNPLTRAVRNGARAASLRVLEKIQPANGGFLEAAPLTSFVVMSLAGMGLGAHPAAAKGVQFLITSARADGSWPIDTNLATWLTTLAVNALGPACRGTDLLRPTSVEHATHMGRSKPAPLQTAIKDWLIAQQYRAEHPFTHAAPGGWSWTDLLGGVPDADDTAGALLALKSLATDEHGLNTETGISARLAANIEHRTSNIEHRREAEAIIAGISWLLDLQNSDGGIPTFCRGWGALPFDRSAPDLTAHALRAFVAWRDDLPQALQKRVDDATQHALHFLAKTQRAGGAWSPLWFGNQYATGEENLTYGTAQVLRGLQELRNPLAAELAARAAAWLLAAQNPDGSWAGAMNTEPRTPNIQHRSEEAAPLDSRLSPLDTRHLSPAPRPSTLARSSSSIEETALAVGALAGVAGAEAAVARGVDWLIAATDGGRVTPAAPIGLYFAKLWYFERLYPLVFLAGALERVAQCQNMMATTRAPTDAA